MLDYTKLKNRITEYFKCDVNFAIKMDMSERTLSLKLNNKGDFTQTQILRACDLLNIPLNEVDSYFFTPKVQRIEQN